MNIKEAISDFSDPEIRFACEWAKKRHDETYAIRSHSKNMYWEHPEGVAKLALAYGGNTTETIAAVCHDTLEDTQASFEEIEVLFGEEVANIVKEVTNDREKISKIGKENYINNELVTLSEPALFVKLCDIFYNILDYPSDSQKERMKKNILFLSDKRDVSEKVGELLEDILTTISDDDELIHTQII